MSDPLIELIPDFLAQVQKDRQQYIDGTSGLLHQLEVSAAWPYVMALLPKLLRNFLDYSSLVLPSAPVAIDDEDTGEFTVDGEEIR